MRRHSLILALTFAISLVVSVTSAQAIVVNDGNPGGSEAGVSIVPGARTNPLPSGVNAVTTTSSCSDPWLSSDLGGPLLPSDGLCYQAGQVIPKNETFALTWDAGRTYWSQTRGYVEQFLKDVADSSGSLGSPYAVVQQYNGSNGRTLNESVYGGGCVDFGSTGGSSCEYGSASQAGHDFPTSGCTPGGDSITSLNVVAVNSSCLTDSQIQSEVSTMVSQTGIVGHTQPGYTPVLDLLMPPGVAVCLDSTNHLCSINDALTPPPPTVNAATTGGSLPAASYQVEVSYTTGTGESMPSTSTLVTTTGSTSSITISPPPTVTGETGWYAYVTQPDGTTFARQQSSPSGINSAYTLGSVSGGQQPPTGEYFCSYHSHVNVGGTDVAYVVQPWSPLTACDEPDVPKVPDNPTPEELSTAAGQRLVSPLAQSETAALVNPDFNGWVAKDGSEIDDNGNCVPVGDNDDQVSLGSGSYFLQHEFNNAGVIESEPNTYFGCAPNVLLTPAFVVPSSVDQGDEVQFDGSATASTLIIPAASYSWNFGDGTTATGPSIVHTYGAGGTYTVTLTVTDRGGNTATLIHTITVLNPNGTAPSSGSTSSSSPGSPTKNNKHTGFNVHLLLLPQGFNTVLKKGLRARVTSNQKADGIATVSISRSAAKRAHIKAGRGPTVVIGVGTLAGLKNGTVSLHLRMSQAVAVKLKRLGHVTLTVRLQLVAADGEHLAIDAAGRY